MMEMRLRIELEWDEAVGGWLAAIDQLPGVMAYGATEDEARRRVKIVALEAMAGLAELGERDIDDAIVFDAA